MFECLAQRMVHLAVHLEIIDPEESELYLYSYGILFSYVANIITILLIGFLSHQIIGILVFLIYFYPLRIFSGGFHASSYTKCYLISVSGIIAITTCEKLIHKLPVYIILFLLCLAGLLIYVKAPLESPNKPMKAKEFLKCRKKARTFYIIESLSIICGLLANIPFMYIYYSLSALIIISALLCFAGKNSKAAGE